jgi:hypothetical protein
VEYPRASKAVLGSDVLELSGVVEAHGRNIVFIRWEGSPPSCIQHWVQIVSCRERRCSSKADVS